ncbi:hypothetical protein, partial [Escherichia coli]|uniref:hypothetical protein n=1 Tax=Escherichia coli TaxID=562 RepID=UPI001F49BE33
EELQGGTAGGAASGTAEGAVGGAAEGAATATAGATAKAKDRAVREQWQSQLKLAAGLMEDAEEKATAAKQLRAEVAWTLTCFDPKAGQGLQKAGHWQPDKFFDSRTQALAPATELKKLSAAGLRELAAARGIHPPEDLERERDRYFRVTSQLLAAQARRKAATQMRDALVRGYVKRDATGRWRGVTEVAGWIGRTQSQVTQICDSGPTSPISDARGQGTGKG